MGIESDDFKELFQLFFIFFPDDAMPDQNDESGRMTCEGSIWDLQL